MTPSVKRAGAGPSLFREATPAVRTPGGTLLWALPAVLLALVLMLPAVA
ncbi:hypothetical protein [Sphingomonas sp.]|jgi:hypothetical protein